ncbi:hypothetical protein [Acinetobacter baumannii]|uniref:hypothetical protein n=1 Tax=Acinetobacter baumannii TaxID=470 RepID=UPI003F5E3904
MTPNERTPMAKFFDLLAYERKGAYVTHKMDKDETNESIHIQVSCGFAKFEKNNQKYEFVFNYQIQEINKDFFTSSKEKLAK